MEATTLLKKKKEIPKLRFREFEEVWGVKTLGKVAEKITIKNRDNSINNVFTNSAVRGIINQRDFFDKDIANQENLLNYYIVNKDDFIYNPRISASAPVGPISRNCIGIGVMSPLYSVFRFKEGDLDFYQIYFSTSKWHEYMESIANYGARADRMNITTGDFYLMPLPSPALLEQKKIASFTLTVDEKILQLIRKRELLEQYKKGVMQQLFSGKLRFNDENGKAYPKWTEKKLRNIAERVTRKNQENNLNVLTISAQQGLINQLEYFKKSISAKDVTNYYLLHKDDFAYNKSYSTGFPMGAIKRLMRYEKGVVSTLYICFRFKENVSFGFMEHYFENGYQNLEIEKVAQEGARNHGLLNIGLNDFFNISLTLPSKHEQDRISNYLSSIDNKIEIVNKQITQTQTFKKGLMQQMFV